MSLRNNFLGNIIGDDLAIAFAAIPPSVKYLNLDNNQLYRTTGAELAKAFTSIPAGITVSLKNNELFVGKTHEQRDELLTQLRLATRHISLDLSENGESDAQRAVVPLVGLFNYGGYGIKSALPKEVFVNILSFLLPVRMPIIERIFLYYVDRHNTYAPQEVLDGADEEITGMNIVQKI